jgi:hypothetical protein
VGFTDRHGARSAHIVAARQRARFFNGNADVPVIFIAVGSVERIGQLLPELGGLLRRPL